MTINQENHSSLLRTLCSPNLHSWAMSYSYWWIHLLSEHGAAKEGRVHQKIPAASERSAIISRMISSESSYGTFGNYNDYLHSSGFRLFRQRWYAMFVKRLLHSKRHKKSMVFQFLIPLMCTLVALISTKILPQPSDFPELVLTTDNFQKNFVPWATDK